LLHWFQASTQLKAEGNKLHGSGKYQAAIEKYERAKSNMEGKVKPEHRELHKACSLNLSMCYLQLGRYEECLAECNAVLSGKGC
jgi:tetratricopeptide (TPR) repeat protein